MDHALLGSMYPTLYHMAEGGTWPSIGRHGLLSTQAIVDLYQPDNELRTRILSTVRRNKITLMRADLGNMTIRDQRPAKFIKECMNDGGSPQDYLEALNGRVFFWLSQTRLERLLNARAYRSDRHTVLAVDTVRLLDAYAGSVQLAPYNTGSMHVPQAPKRGPDIFVNVEDYPYEVWQAKRGRATEAVVELTVPYAIPDISDFVIDVHEWEDGRPTTMIYTAR